MLWLEKSAKISRHCGSLMFFASSPVIFAFLLFGVTHLPCSFIVIIVSPARYTHTHVFETMCTHMMKQYTTIDNHDMSLYYELFNTEYKVDYAETTGGSLGSLLNEGAQFIVQEVTRSLGNVVGDQRLRKVMKLEGKTNSLVRRRNVGMTARAAATMARAAAAGEAIPFANHRYRN